MIKTKNNNSKGTATTANGPMSINELNNGQMQASQPKSARKKGSSRFSQLDGEQTPKMTQLREMRDKNNSKSISSFREHGQKSMRLTQNGDFMKTTDFSSQGFKKG